MPDEIISVIYVKWSGVDFFAIRIVTHAHTDTNCRFFDVSMTGLAIAYKFRFRIAFHRDRDASILSGLWDMIFCLIEGMRYRYGNVKERDV